MEVNCEEIEENHQMSILYQTLQDQGETWLEDRYQKQRKKDQSLRVRKEEAYTSFVPSSITASFQQAHSKHPPCLTASLSLSLSLHHPAQRLKEKKKKLSQSWCWIGLGVGCVLGIGLGIPYSPNKNK